MPPALKTLRRQWFPLALLGVLAAAWLAPGVGAGLLRGSDGARDTFFRDAAIVLIFFMTGLGLPTRALAAGFKNGRLHLAVFVLSFAVWPLLMWLAVHPIRVALGEGLVVGFYLLAVLPTTISTCVVFTQIARGNAAGALFNAVATNIAGLVLSPALLLLMVGAGGASLGVDSGAVARMLCAQVLVPLAAGQAAQWLILRTRPGAAPPKFFARLPAINSALVLWIVYLSFCETFGPKEAGREAAGVNAVGAAALAALAPLQIAGIWACWRIAALLRFERGDAIALTICGVQKTLAMGVPLATACLAARPELLGTALLPLLVFHPVQLIVSGWLAGHWRHET